MDRIIYTYYIRMKKLNIDLITIPDFHFKDNKIIRDYIDSLIQDSYDFTHIFKLLGCKSNINRDFIITKLERKSVQSKIIKKITNYKKIPKKTLDYYKTNCDKEISDEDIINAILKYLQKKYNEQSIFWIDIDTIYFNGWNKNGLDEEGPREYIDNILCKSNSTVAAGPMVMGAAALILLLLRSVVANPAS